MPEFTHNAEENDAIATAMAAALTGNSLAEAEASYQILTVNQTPQNLSHHFEQE